MPRFSCPVAVGWTGTPTQPPARPSGASSCCGHTARAGVVLHPEHPPGPGPRHPATSSRRRGRAQPRGGPVQPRHHRLGLGRSVIGLQAGPSSSVGAPPFVAARALGRRKATEGSRSAGWVAAVSPRASGVSARPPRLRPWRTVSGATGKKNPARSAGRVKAAGQKQPFVAGASTSGPCAGPRVRSSGVRARSAAAAAGREAPAVGRGAPRRGAAINGSSCHRRARQSVGSGGRAAAAPLPAAIQ